MFHLSIYHPSIHPSSESLCCIKMFHKQHTYSHLSHMYLKVCPLIIYPWRNISLWFCMSWNLSHHPTGTNSAWAHCGQTVLTRLICAQNLLGLLRWGAAREGAWRHILLSHLCQREPLSVLNLSFSSFSPRWPCMSLDWVNKPQLRRIWSASDGAVEGGSRVQLGFRHPLLLPQTAHDRTADGDQCHSNATHKHRLYCMRALGIRKAITGNCGVPLLHYGWNVNEVISLYTNN